MTNPSKPIATSTLPETGLLRLPDVLRQIPVSRSTIYAKIKAGAWPAPVRLSKRVVAWKSSDIRDLLERFEKGDAL
ncbi:AlpA family phage regulatory protein [Rhizobium leguminosarum]|uniref:helix-turn-helix transcriptional regulator n=1 Tax=Rhizobium leguminosarum TaxID=384 RepID=UPI001030603E|nr:AlpA family phage regulatory protein [Rhizobium leguminosarum]TAX99818.1 AlpA family phage regulatory protein [Rhizobium leguminosarum]TAZ59963.1 AlpA family phage regulatory protein [Rhizobium leguminosarum]